MPGGPHFPETARLHLPAPHQGARSPPSLARLTPSRCCTAVAHPRIPPKIPLGCGPSTYPVTIQPGADTVAGVRHTSLRRITCPAWLRPLSRWPSPGENRPPIERPQAPGGGAQIGLAVASSGRRLEL